MRRHRSAAALTAKQVTAPRSILRDPELSVADITRQLGVAVATLYTHVPGGRGSVTGEGEISA